MVIVKMLMMPEHMLNCIAVMFERAVAYQTYDDVRCSCELYCHQLVQRQMILAWALTQWGQWSVVDGKETARAYCTDASQRMTWRPGKPCAVALYHVLLRCVHEQVTFGAPIVEAA